MDAAGVTAAVVAPPGWDLTSADYVAAAVDRCPDRFAAYATLALNQPEAHEDLRRCRDTEGVVALRFLCMAPDEVTWPQDGSVEPMFALAEELGMPVMLCGPTLMPIVGRTAQRFPALRLVVDHFGLIGYGDDGGLVQSPDVLAWAAQPNVAVKLTGAPDYATDSYPFPSMGDVVHRLYDVYGPDRLFWGSDITRVNGHGGTRYKASWRQCVTMFTEHMSWLSDSDLELIMGEAFCDWVGWPPITRNTTDDLRTTGSQT
jgi:predicted TIM-barrel fold metal-dependent hydrolase